MHLASDVISCPSRISRLLQNSNQRCFRVKYAFRVKRQLETLREFQVSAKSITSLQLSPKRNCHVLLRVHGQNSQRNGYTATKRQNSVSYYGRRALFTTEKMFNSLPPTTAVSNVDMLRAQCINGVYK